MTRLSIISPRVLVRFAALAAAISLASCSSPFGRRTSDEAASAPPASAAPESTSVLETPVSPELAAIEHAIAELDTLAARAAVEIAPLVEASDSVYSAAADAEAARLRWARWGEPWNAKLAALERALPPEPANGASHSLRYANRSVRTVIYELRLVPSVDPEQPVPPRADAEKHLDNARRALVDARALAARARVETAGV